MASSAFAHAEFHGSSPAADAILDGVPMYVSLQFSEPVGALALEWQLPDGQRVAATGMAMREGLSISSPPGTQRGTSVLLIAMCFRLTPPPGAETGIDPIHLHLHSAEGLADITFSAPPPGAVDISLMVSDRDARPLQPRELSLS